MELVRITEKSAELNDEPGRYYVLVSPTNPSDAWEAAFLGASENDADGRRLALKVDGSRITYRPLDGKTTAECERMIQGFMDQVGK